MSNNKAPHQVPAYNEFFVELNVNDKASPPSCRKRPDICNNVLDAIGNTPVVKLNRVVVSDKVTVLVKLEFLNPGGSIKDRAVKFMLQDHLSSIEQDSQSVTLIEASSGNTGIAMAMAAAALHCKSTITMSESMSIDKQKTLESLGSNVIRTNLEAATFCADSHCGVARQVHQRLLSEGRRAIYCDQYVHPGNPIGHFLTTAPEIFEQTGANLQFIVIGVGTTGTIRGVAAYIKRFLPQCKIVAVEPEGSVIHASSKLYINRRRSVPPEVAATRVPIYINETNKENAIEISQMVAKKWKTEGIGKDFLTPLLDPSQVDIWMVIDDKTAFRTARQTIREEGLLIGGSAGSLIAAANRLISSKIANEGDRILCLLPDGAHNYFSSFLDDGWMLLAGFLDIEQHKLFRTLTKTYSDCALDFDKHGHIAMKDCPTCIVKSSNESARSTLSSSANRNGPELIVIECQGTVISILSKYDLHSRFLRRLQFLGRSESPEQITLKDLVSKQKHFALKVFAANSASLCQAITELTELERLDSLSLGLAVLTKTTGQRSSPIAADGLASSEWRIVVKSFLLSFLPHV